LTVVAQDGSPVVERVEVGPRGGEFDHDQLATIRRALPPGGLPLRAVRSLTFTDALNAARQMLAEASDYTLNRHRFTRATLDAPRRPGKKGRPDRYYAEVAAAYVQAIERGSRHPAQDVAARRNEKPQYIRSLLLVARDRGLLTGHGRGRAGGALTPKAKAILAQAAQAKG
jgi:hypothetical protein